MLWFQRSDTSRAPPLGCHRRPLAPRSDRRVECRSPDAGARSESTGVESRSRPAYQHRRDPCVEDDEEDGIVGTVDGEAVCERFGLGTLRALPRVAASGWGGHNRMWRLETAAGVIAVKEVRRELPVDTEAPYRIELAAHDAGIPSAKPIPSVDGTCFSVVDGAAIRCHEWVAGKAKANEDTSSAEAQAMGAIVARLHGLRIDAAPTVSASSFGRHHWLDLAARASVGSFWASLIRDHIDLISDIEKIVVAGHDADTVGSHRDLNAHNVLFTEQSLVLIDWDAAGAASVRYERASYATLWAQDRDGGGDLARAVAFLRGYRSAGGPVERDDPAAIPMWLAGVVRWAEQNVRLALTRRSDGQDELATLLVQALIDGPATVVRRQMLLAEAIARI